MTDYATDVRASGIIQSLDDIIATARLVSNTGVLALFDLVSRFARVVAISFDPTIGAGEPLCPRGSLALRTDVPTLYIKTADAPDTAWVPLSTGTASLVMPLVNVAAPAALPSAGNFYQVSVPLVGPATVTLPLAASVANGATLAVRLVTPQNGVLSVAAAGGDTVNGVASIDYPGNGPDDRYGAIYVSDGVSQWRSVGDNTVFPSLYDDNTTLFLNPQNVGALVNIANVWEWDSATGLLTMSPSDAIVMQATARAQSRWNWGNGTDGVITPAALPVGNTNDYSPAGLASANTIRLSTAVGSLLTGIDVSVYLSAAAADGVLIMLINAGANPLVLVTGSAASVAANRFTCPGAVNYTIQTGGGVFIRYDGTSARWRVVANA